MTVRADWEFRGLHYQSTDPDLLDRLGAGGVTGYIGFDPTAPSLHLGSLLQICLLRRLQESGNRPIALAGGGTGLIGDPSFKDAERPLLTAEQLDENIEGIKGQLSRFLDFSPAAGSSQALLLNNADWLTTVPLTTFLRDVGKHVTVNQMVAKDSVKNRLDREDVGLSYTEFSYMLLQGYDFVKLNELHGCTLQMGGSDQWGNITVGADLVKKINGNKADGMTSPLLLRSDGKKFGKSEGGQNVWLDAERTSPFAMYQYLLNVDDELTPKLLRFFTFLSHDEILDLERRMAEAPQERAGQKALAHEVVTMVHGLDEARGAARAGEALFSEAIASLDERTLLAVVADAPTSNVSRASLEAGLDPVELVVNAGLAGSKAEARRFLDQGGVYINNVRVESEERIGSDRALFGQYLVLRRGKRQMHLIVVA
jgi:tyrosyl-tRNA synthetase